VPADGTSGPSSSLIDGVGSGRRFRRLALLALPRPRGGSGSASTVGAELSRHGLVRVVQEGDALERGKSSSLKRRPISIELTSASAGTSIGASTLSVVDGWERTPPSFTPGASSAPAGGPAGRLDRDVEPHPGGRWPACPRIRSRWYSFRRGVHLGLALRTTSSTACSPEGSQRKRSSHRDGEACAVVLRRDAERTPACAGAELGRAESRARSFTSRPKSVAGHGGG
jgi:hypothetical protein